MQLGLLIQKLEEIQKQHGPTLEVKYHAPETDFGIVIANNLFESVDFIEVSNYKGELIAKLF